jgi:hypothetical protein
MTYPVNRLDGMNSTAVEKLRKQGIRTTRSFLDRTKQPRGRKALAALTGLEEKQLLRWANRADLMRIKGIGEEYAELLVMGGVDTVRALSTRNAERLYKALHAINEQKKLVRFMPSPSLVGRWVEEAKKLPTTLRY